MAFDRRSGQILVAGMAKSIYLYAAVVAFDRMVNRSVADRARVDFVRATQLGSRMLLSLGFASLNTNRIWELSD